MNKYTVAHIKSFYTDEKKKTDSNLPFFHRKIVRPISFYLTIPFLYLGFSANQVTFLSLIFAIAGNIGFALGTFDSMRIGVILILFAIELDFVDGNIARFWQKPNQYGAFLDGSFGVLMYTLMPLCIGMGISQNSGNMYLSTKTAIITGAFVSIIYLFNNYIQWRYKAQLTIVVEKKISPSIINNNKSGVKNPPLVWKFVKIFLKLIGGFNSNYYIPSLILLFFRMPGVLFLIHIFIIVSSSLIIVARIYRKAYYNLNPK